MSYGLNKEGFKRKRYEDVIASLETRAKDLFGPDFNLSPRSPQGLFIRLVAWSIALLWQVIEYVYNSAYVDTAEGVSLERVGKNIGIKKRAAVRATGSVDFSGDEGTLITEGFLVATTDGIQFETTEAATIDVSGTVTVSVRAVDPGTSGNVAAGKITTIVNPSAGITSVTNSAATSGGLNRETDPEFREKYYKSVAIGGASTLDSIRASLLGVDGVRAAVVIANNTMAIDGDGRPPKSIEAYVLGGQAADIAQTVLNTKAAGIESYGYESQVVYDNADNPHTIKFTYATTVDVYVNVTVTKNDKYPADGSAQVRTALIKYIGGQDADGSSYSGLGMGQDVIYTRLISEVFKIPGIDDITLEVSTDGFNYTSSNIATAQAEVAETDSAKVVVTSA